MCVHSLPISIMLFKKNMLLNEQITFYVLKKSVMTGSQIAPLPTILYKFLRTSPTQSNLFSCPEMVSSLQGRYLEEFGRWRIFCIDLSAKNKIKLPKIYNGTAQVT